MFNFYAFVTADSFCLTSLCHFARLNKTYLFSILSINVTSTWKTSLLLTAHLKLTSFITLYQIINIVL